MSRLTPLDRRVALRPVRALADLPADAVFPRAALPEDYGADPAPRGLDLHELLALLRRNALLIVGAAALGAAAVAGVVLSSPPKYQATGIIRLKDVRSAIAGGIGEVALEGMMMGRTTDPLLSELEILRSPAVAEAVVEAEGLRVRTDPAVPARLLRDVRVAPGFTSDTLGVAFSAAGATVTSRAGRRSVRYGEPVRLEGLELTIAAAPGVERAELAVVTAEQALRDFQASLRAKPRDKTDVVDVQYQATDPELAQRVLNTTLSEFQELNTRTAQEQSRRRRTFVEEQLQSTDSLLAAAQVALSAFQGREQVFSSNERFAAEQANLLGLGVRREELAAERRIYQSLLRGVQEAGGKGGLAGLGALIADPGIAANPAIVHLYERLVRYQVSLDSMTTGRFARSPNNPDVQSLTSLVAATRADLVSAVRGQVEAVDTRLAALDQLKAGVGRTIQALPASGAEEVRLTQKVETIKKVADQLREEYQKARVAEVVEAGQVELLSPARLPQEPVPGYGPLKIALGLAAGLLFGLGGAFVREQMDTSIARTEELETLLQLPALGVIPHIAPSVPAAKRLGRGAARRDEERLIMASPGGGLGAEAYRTLRTNLLFSQAMRSLRTLVVTSSAPSEGKTTTAANLAISFAQQGMRVLLVDCDLRRARVHKVFRVPSSPGLTQLVLGLDSAAEAIRPTGVDGLCILPAGALPPNPSELLGSDRLKETLRGLVAAYDVVILDTPPLLAASDAAVLGVHADGVLMVVRAGQTERAAAQHAVQQLDAVGARVLGAVLNDPDSKIPQQAGYYGSYAYEYGPVASA